MGVETVFGIASTLCLLVGALAIGAFLSPQFRSWMAQHGSRISPRIGRLLRDGLGDRES